MHCTLLIPDLLPPPDMGDEPYAKLGVPSLELLFARGDTVAHAPQFVEAWLCDSFGVPRQRDLPLAALMLKADGGDPGPHYWLCADPVQLRVDSSRLIVTGRVDDLTAEETAALITTLNQHFAADGLSFCAPTPARWYLSCARAPQLVTTPLARALNRSVKHHQPRGDDALAWHRIMTEAQMILHAHPVTAAREARGAAAANSLWLWGGGTLPVTSAPQLAAAWGGAHPTRALAAAAGIAHRELPALGADFLAAASAGHHLVVIDAAAAALRNGGIDAWRAQLALLEERWMRPLLTALRTRELSGLTLVACNDDCMLEAKMAREHAWRFWRRTRPLATYAANPRPAYAS
jgi:hypothetical protein